jgi:hypothetical protein
LGIAEFIVPAGSFFRLFLPFGEYGLLEKNERDQSLQKLDPREMESQELTRKQAVFTNMGRSHFIPQITEGQQATSQIM